jgi:8-amino-7-oxononanoate synthase
MIRASVPRLRVVLLCSNNYLGLADDPRVRSAAASAARRWGTGSGASRLVSGTTALHRDLELALADLEGAEDAVLFSSGYLANIGVLTTLTGPDDAADSRRHASPCTGTPMPDTSRSCCPRRTPAVGSS